MNTEYDKPFKTYDEMLSLMEKRNIIINDKEFAKTQIDKASSFLAGYNSNKDLIIKIYNKENK